MMNLFKNQDLKKFLPLLIPIFVYSINLLIEAYVVRMKLTDDGWFEWRVILLASLFLIFITSLFLFDKDSAGIIVCCSSIGPYLVYLLVCFLYAFLNFSFQFPPLEWFSLVVLCTYICPFIAMMAFEIINP